MLLAAQLIERKWGLREGEQEGGWDDVDSNLAKVTVTASGWQAHKPRNELIAASVCAQACAFGWVDECVCDDRDQLIAEGAAWEQAVS